MTPSIEMMPALARMRTELRCIRYELAARKYVNSLKAEALLRAKYSPKQPRVPP